MSSKKDTIKTPLKKAKAYGSSHEGGHHWIMERLTSVALIPLVIWFVASIISLVGSDHFALVEFLSHPLNAVLMALLVGFSFYHAALGLVVVIEDYIHVKCAKITALLVVKLGCLAVGLATIVAVAKLHFAL